MGLMRNLATPFSGPHLRLPTAAGMRHGGRIKPHFVRPHTSHSAHGRPVHVRGHWAAGGAHMRTKKVRAHTRMTHHGPVHVRAHAKGMGAMRRVKPHVRHTARGLVRVRGHVRYGGLLSP